jgi:S-formylglutathione hydrolase FrmB
MRIPSVVLAWLLLSAVAAPAAAAPGDLPAGDSPAARGAEVVSVRAEGERLVTLEVESPSVGRTFVSLLLPSRYAAEAERTWPVLYLLHGANNDHTTWLSQTDVEALTADLDVLVVMPDGGQYGFYSDWWDGGESGLAGWETYHLEELPRILERDFRAADARAVAGNSMGGFGAISYAARRPGMFQAAASFSGVLDIFALGRLGEDVWGDRQEQRENWQAHDPISLAAALDGTALYVAWGNGEPGPLDADGTRFDVLEAWLAAGNQRFVERLAEVGLPATIEAYGPGTHAWPYWEAALEDALPLLMTSLGVSPTS